MVKKYFYLIFISMIMFRLACAEGWVISENSIKTFEGVTLYGEFKCPEKLVSDFQLRVTIDGADLLLENGREIEQYYNTEDETLSIRISLFLDPRNKSGFFFEEPGEREIAIQHKIGDERLTNFNVKVEGQGLSKMKISDSEIHDLSGYIATCFYFRSELTHNDKWIAELNRNKQRVTNSSIRSYVDFMVADYAFWLVYSKRLSHKVNRKKWLEDIRLHKASLKIYSDNIELSLMRRKAIYTYAYCVSLGGEYEEAKRLLTGSILSNALLKLSPEEDLLKRVDNTARNLDNEDEISKKWERIINKSSSDGEK